MAEEQKKLPRKRKLAKKPESVRDRAKKASDTKGKTPRRKKITSSASKPAGHVGSFLTKSLPIHAHDDDAAKVKGFFTKHRSPIPSYLRGAASEITMVTWPTFKEAMRLTLAVFVFAAVFALLISGLDWVLDQIFEEVILNESQNIKDWLNDIF